MAKNLTSFTKRGVERRALGSRQASRRILIVCGGQKTEPNYFNELRRVRSLTATLVIEGVGELPVQLVKRAIEKILLEGDFDAAYVVFDRDSFADFVDAINMAKNFRSDQQPDLHLILRGRVSRYGYCSILSTPTRSSLEPETILLAIASCRSLNDTILSMKKNTCRFFQKFQRPSNSNLPTSEVNGYAKHVMTFGTVHLPMWTYSLRHLIIQRKPLSFLTSYLSNFVIANAVKRSQYAAPEIRDCFTAFAMTRLKIT